MLGRFDVTPLIRGHVKTLSNKGKTEVRPDYLTRIALPGISLAVGVLGGVEGWALPAATDLLAGVALLAGASLSAFAYLGSLRLLLTDRREDRWLDVERDSLDEGATHLLLIVLLSVIDAALLIVGLNAAPVTSLKGTVVAGAIHSSGWAWTAMAVSVYIGLLFVVLLPRLYSAYIEMNEVRAELSGFHRSRRGTNRHDVDTKHR